MPCGAKTARVCAMPKPSAPSPCCAERCCPCYANRCQIDFPAPTTTSSRPSNCFVNLLQYPTEKPCLPKCSVASFAVVVLSDCVVVCSVSTVGLSVFVIKLWVAFLDGFHGNVKGLPHQHLGVEFYKPFNLSLKLLPCLFPRST